MLTQTVFKTVTVKPSSTVSYSLVDIHTFTIGTSTIVVADPTLATSPKPTISSTSTTTQNITSSQYITAGLNAASSEHPVVSATTSASAGRALSANGSMLGWGFRYLTALLSLPSRVLCDSVSTNTPQHLPPSEHPNTNDNPEPNSPHPHQQRNLAVTLTLPSALASSTIPSTPSPQHPLPNPSPPLENILGAPRAITQAQNKDLSLSLSTAAISTTADQSISATHISKPAGASTDSSAQITEIISESQHTQFIAGPDGAAYTTSVRDVWVSWLVDGDGTVSWDVGPRVGKTLVESVTGETAAATTGQSAETAATSTGNAATGGSIGSSNTIAVATTTGGSTGLATQAVGVPKGQPTYVDGAWGSNDYGQVQSGVLASGAGKVVGGGIWYYAASLLRAARRSFG